VNYQDKHSTVKDSLITDKLRNPTHFNNSRLKQLNIQTNLSRAARTDINSKLLIDNWYYYFKLF